MAEELPISVDSVFTNCKLTISNKVSTNDKKLFKFITDKLQFKIIGFDPLVVEKDCPSQQDIQNLSEVLHESLDVEDAGDYVIVSNKNDYYRDSSETARKQKQNKSSLQITQRSVPELGERLIKQNESDEERTEKFSKHHVIYSDSNICAFANSFQCLQMNDEDGICAKEINKQVQLEVIKNVPNRHESDQTIEPEPCHSLVAYPDQLLIQDNSLSCFDENSKPAVSQTAYDSFESLHAEKESNINVSKVKEHEAKCELSNRQSNIGNSFSQSEIMPQAKLAGNDLAKRETDITQELQCTMVLQKITKVTESTNQETECHLEADRDREINCDFYKRNSKKNLDIGTPSVGTVMEFSRDEKCEQATAAGIYYQKMETRDESLKHLEPCNTKNIIIDCESKIGKTYNLIEGNSKTQNEDGACEKITGWRNEIDKRVETGSIPRGEDLESTRDSSEKKVTSRQKNSATEFTEMHSVSANLSQKESFVTENMNVDNELSNEYYTKGRNQVSHAEDCRQSKLQKDIETSVQTTPQDHYSVMQEENMTKQDGTTRDLSLIHDREIESSSYLPDSRSTFTRLTYPSTEGKLSQWENNAQKEQTEKISMSSISDLESTKDSTEKQTQNRQEDCTTKITERHSMSTYLSQKENFVPEKIAIDQQFDKEYNTNNSNEASDAVNHKHAKLPMNYHKGMETSIAATQDLCSLKHNAHPKESQNKQDRDHESISYVNDNRPSTVINQPQWESDKNLVKTGQYSETQELRSRQNQVHSSQKVESSLLQNMMIWNKNDQFVQDCKETQLYERYIKSQEETHNFDSVEEIASNSHPEKKLSNETLMLEDSCYRDNFTQSQLQKVCGQFLCIDASKTEEMYGRNCEFNESIKFPAQRKFRETNTNRQAVESNTKPKQSGKKSETQAHTLLQISESQHPIIQKEGSSDSEGESQDEVIYSLKALSFNIAQHYYSKTCFKSYFDKAEDEGKHFTFRLNPCNEKDIAFLAQLKKQKFEELELEPENRDYVRSLAPILMSDMNGLTIDIEDRRLYVIGSKNTVALVNKILTSPKDMETYMKAHKDNRAAKYEKTSQMSELKVEDKFDAEKHYSQGDSEVTGNEIKKSRGLGLQSKTLQPSRTTHEQHVSSLLLHEKSHYPKTNDYDLTKTGIRGTGAYSSTYNDNYSDRSTSQLIVRIDKADITKLEVDCIVNAANKRLQHLGGVAKAIAEAAGPALKKECEDYIKAVKFVAVTENFVSTGGHLPAKYVMHAVGPKWEAYDEKSKSQCLDHLRKTVLRCLVEAGRRGITSIALPSISAAIFKVPKEMCAQCYINAVRNFEMFNADEKSSLHEVHFVDVDDTMVNLIRECYFASTYEPRFLDFLQIDLHFARQHLHSASKNETLNQLKKSGHENKLSDPNKPRSPSVLTGQQAGASEMRATRKSKITATYQVGQISLLTYIGHAFDQSSDITITIGKPFDKLSGLHDFKISPTTAKRDENKYFIKNIFEFLNISNLIGKQSKLVCTVLPEPNSQDNIQEAFKNLDKAIHNSQQYASLVLTSSVLYSEPANKPQQKGSKNIDSKKVGKFAQYLFDYLKPKSALNISVVVVGCEDAILAIQKVIESRGINRTMSGAYPLTNQRTERTPETTFVRSEHQSDVGTSVDPEKCLICVRRRGKPVRCCNKIMCQNCEQRLSCCPYCRIFWKIVPGNQPPGQMKVRWHNECVPGYENDSTWAIEYYFPAGVQQGQHPSPGKLYSTVTRIAYLPTSRDGYDVLILLRIAFLRKLTFTIGFSSSRNKDDVITWNDIHHKTSKRDPQYGYPDNGYLQRVMEELASKGVRMDTITDSEKLYLGHFLYCIDNRMPFFDHAVY